MSHITTFVTSRDTVTCDHNLHYDPLAYFLLSSTPPLHITHQLHTKMGDNYSMAQFAREHGFDPNDFGDDDDIGEMYADDSGVGLYPQIQTEGYEIDRGYDDYMGKYMRCSIMNFFVTLLQIRLRLLANEGLIIHKFSRLPSNILAKEDPDSPSNLQPMFHLEAYHINPIPQRMNIIMIITTASPLTIHSLMVIPMIHTLGEVTFLLSLQMSERMNLLLSPRRILR